MVNPVERELEAIRAEQELLPCPNPWCHRSEGLPPQLSWVGPRSCAVECSSCGLQGPSFCPVVINDDGEIIGTQDAEALAIKAWNTHAGLSDLRERYDQLILSVAQKHPGESRHETALRYIRERENQHSDDGREARHA